jgi:UDP-N-acetylmuramoyl-tripeptide--D-alanyl-D-alanine ligase
MKDIRSSILWWAADRRLAKDKPFVIAVTGSIAKTSTKEAVGAVLKAAYGAPRVRVGYGNLNTNLGLPLAILDYKLDFYAQKISWQWPFLLLGALWRGLFIKLPNYLVLEMGADRPGDLTQLTAHVRPDIGVLTIVGEAHLVNYQSSEKLAAEKSQLVSATKPDGVVILYQRDPFLDLHLRNAASRVVKIDCPLSGIARRVAETVGELMKIPPETVTDALNQSWQPEGRLKLSRGRYTVLDDSYNASPASMRSAFEAFRELPGRRIAVLGSMLELGQDEVRYHQQVGEAAREVASLVIGVGELAKHYQPDYWFADSDQAQRSINSMMEKGGSTPAEEEPPQTESRQHLPIFQPGDSILVKGSHGIRMDKIVEVLKH